MSRLRLVSVVAAFAFVLVLSATAAPARATAKPRLTTTVPSQVQVGAPVKVGVRWTGRRGTRLVVERRLTRGWKTVTTGRLGSSAKTVIFAAPNTVQKLVVRVRLMNRGRTIATSPKRSVFIVKKPVTSAPPVTVTVRGDSPPPMPTRAPPPRYAAPITPDAGTLAEAPPAGQAGVLRIRGSVDAKVGQSVAIGITERTPFGYLGKVTSVTSENGETVLGVEPAAMQQVIPEADIDVDITSAPPQERQARQAFGTPAFEFANRTHPMQCGAGVSASATASARAGFSAKLKLRWKGTGVRDWDFDPGYPEGDIETTFQARVTGEVTTSAAAHCDLKSVEFPPISLAPIEFSVSGVPVVIVPRLGATLDASIQATGEAHARGELSWDPTASLHVTGARSAYGSFSGLAPKFTTDVGARATGDARVTVRPKLELLLYGVAGPEVAVPAGLHLTADTAAAKCWGLTAPVSLEAALVVPQLNWKFGPYTLWDKTLRLAEADGPCFREPDPVPPLELLDITTTRSGTHIDMAYRLHAPHGLDLWRSGFQFFCYDATGQFNNNTIGGALIESYSAETLPATNDEIVFHRTLDLTPERNGAVRGDCRMSQARLTGLDGESKLYGEESFDHTSGQKPDFPFPNGNFVLFDP